MYQPSVASTMAGVMTRSRPSIDRATRGSPGFTGGRFISSYDVADLVPQLHDCTQPKAGQSAGEHFVTILDGSVRARRTMLYHPGREISSVIGLAPLEVNDSINGLTITSN